MTAIVNYLTNNLPYADKDEKEFLQTTIDELNTELNRGVEKAQANRALYATAHDVIMRHLPDTPVTVAELYETCKGELPENFSKSKVQYGITNYWADEVVKIEGAPNQYRRA